MKKIIEQLARGDVCVSRPQVKCSSEQIHIKIEAGQDFTGKLTISSENDCLVEGKIYSTHRYIQLSEHSFSGMENTIHYTLAVGSELRGIQFEGEFQLITNGGELIIPFFVTIGKVLLDTSIGRISSLDDYLSLIDHNEEEAVVLFRTENFKKVIIGDNHHLAHLYDCITKSGTSRKLALQEFLSTLHINKQMIEDSYKVQEKRSDVEQVDVSEDMCKKDADYRKIIIQIMRDYLQFRMGLMDKEKYVQQAEAHILSYLEQLPTDQWTADALFYRLYLVQLYIISEQMGKADQVLSEISEEIFTKDGNEAVYCYYLYIKSLKTKDAQVIGKNLSMIHEIYKKNDRQWSILWCLLYLDKSYKKDMNKRYEMIRKQCVYGCTSPILYYEALAVFNEEPGVIRELGVIELRILLWGAKNQFIYKSLSSYVGFLVSNQKNYSRAIYVILENLYFKYKEKDILSAMISMLIKGNVVSKKMHYWYELGVAEGIKMTELYEYFIRTIDKTLYPVLPRSILLYFIYNSNINDLDKAYLYANIIHHRENDVSIYSSYMKNIELFVADQVSKNNINDHLCVLYDHILAGARITRSIAKALPMMIFKHEIIVEDPKIKAVAVKHEECKEEEMKLLVDKRAIVDIYTNRHTVILIDSDNNRYVSTVPFRKRAFMDFDRYSKKCADLGSISTKLMYHLVGTSMEKAWSDQTAQWAERLVQVDNIEEAYQQQIEYKLMEYYYEINPDVFEEYLLGLDLTLMRPGQREVILEYYLERGLYNIAINPLMQYGYEQIEADKLLKMVNGLIREFNYESHVSFDYLSSYLLNHNKVSQVIIQYAVDNFKGSMSQLTNIWNIAVSMKAENAIFAERVILQALLTDMNNESVRDIFLYYCTHEHQTTVILAYLTRIAYEYVIKGTVLSQNCIEMIENEFMDSRCNRVMEIGLLKHYAEKSVLTERQLKWAESRIKVCILEDIQMAFFKNFHEHFLLPNEIGDKTIVEYRTRPRSKVSLHYSLCESELQSFRSVKMKEVFPGVYVYSTILFYNDTMQYYILDDSHPQEDKPKLNVLEYGDMQIEGPESGIDLINMMLMSRQMGDDETLDAILQYFGRGIVKADCIYKPIP